MSNRPLIDVATLLAAARRPQDLRTRALAGIIGTAAVHGRTPLIRGLSEARFQKLINEYFPLAGIHNGRAFPPDDEFAGLLALLLDHRVEPSEENAWLAHAIASAATDLHSLVEDMGLDDEGLLARLMRENFPTLAERNAEMTKWKRFLHRQLCARAGIVACELDQCPVCCARGECFDGKEAA